MSSAEGATSLQEQLTNARREIHNLRKQLNALQHIHRKGIDKLTKTLENWQCSSCKQRDQKPESLCPSLTHINNEDFIFKPIGVINSEFPQLRGTPRQPTVTVATARLTLSKEVFTNPSHALEDLDHFSHLWVIFAFHKNSTHAKAKVAPPRLNGVRTGVFATRSPHRPCPIGLSLVKIEKIVDNVVYFTGVDMVDQTPVLDIKPYIPQYDKPKAETNVELLGQEEISDFKDTATQDSVKVPSWIDQAPVHKLTVTYNHEALKQLQDLEPKLADERSRIISNVLQEDPRSVYLRAKWSCDSYIWRIDNLCVACKFNDVDHAVEIVRVFRDV